MEPAVMEATVMARRGGFDAALSQLDALAATFPMNPRLTFCNIRILETQGYLNRAFSAGILTLSNLAIK